MSVRYITTVNKEKNMETKEVVESDLVEMTMLKDNMMRHSKRKKTGTNSAETMASIRRLDQWDSQKQFYTKCSLLETKE
jgi:hypothetical protein